MSRLLSKKMSYLMGQAIVVLTIHLLVFPLCAANKKLTEFDHPMTNPEDHPELPNVLLIGDSISIKYTIPVRKLLVGKADVFRPRTNCGPSEKGVANIKKWLAKKKWDIIHFNFGIWDTHFMFKGKIVSDLSQHKVEDLKRRANTEQYIHQLQTILISLKATGAKLIWASTTPLTGRKDTSLLLVKNNEAAKKLMQAEGLWVNDLYGLTFPHLKEWQLKDGTHYNFLGANAQAKQVVSKILSVLGGEASKAPAPPSRVERKITATGAQLKINRR